MKAYGGVMYRFTHSWPWHTGGEWSASRHSCFTPPPRYPLDRRPGWLLNLSGWHREKKNIVPTGAQTQTPCSSSLRPVLYWPCYPSSCASIINSVIRWYTKIHWHFIGIASNFDGNFIQSEDFSAKEQKFFLHVICTHHPEPDLKLQSLVE
jgi:hypothetical protein